MKTLSIKRYILSKDGLNVLKRISFGEDKEEQIMKENNSEENIMETKVNDNALGVLYKNLNDHKVQRKPLVYFFVGFALGALSVLFLSAVVLVSDKDSIENDVKTVKETVKETVAEQQLSVTSETEPIITEGVFTDENGEKFYIVKEGDTLGGIVNRIYGDSSTYNPEKVAKFKEANGLKSIHVLKIGQRLVIPE